MATLIDRLTGTTPRVVTPRDETAAEASRTALAARRASLAGIRQHLDHVESAVASLRAQRATGRPIDTPMFAALCAKADALTRQVVEHEADVAALQASVGAWNEDEARRRYAGVVAAMQRLSDAAPADEVACARLLAALAPVMARMNAAGSRFDVLAHERHALEAAHSFNAATVRRPYAPPLVGESFFTSADPPVPMDRWLADWVRDHPGFGEPDA